MTSSDPSTGTARLRRPVPQRTAPRRNILGVFQQKDGAGQAAAQPPPPQAAPVFTGAPPEGGHPLGLPMDEAETEAPKDHITPDFDQEAMNAASSVVDKHIRKGPDYTISTDTSGWKKLSSVAGSVDPKEIADLVKALTQGYAVVAHSWVEMANKLRDVLGKQPAPAASTTQAAPAPTLCLQSSRKLSARVEIFGSGTIQTVHPLAPEAADGGVMITDVAYADGQIDIHVPDSVAAGRYHGVILSDASAPMGVVTVAIPGPDGAAP